MKVLGIIAEYNPFHNGHKYQLQESLYQTNANYTIAIMSGHFLQRGEPALFSKWTRAKMAVENGIDLVLELPVSYAVRSAPDFAFGAVQMLQQTGIVEYLSFGSESGNLAALQEAASLLAQEPIAVSQEIQIQLKKGSSYPKAQMLAWQKVQPKIAKLLRTPNNLLGIEYLKALSQLNSQIKPLTITRKQAFYHEQKGHGHFASASAIRAICLDNLEREAIVDAVAPFVPPSVLLHIEEDLQAGQAPVTLASFSQILLALLRRSDPTHLTAYLDVQEGLEHRFKQSAHAVCTIESFLDAVKTKRYTRVKLQRILLHLLLNFQKKEALLFHKANGPQYLRVLHFSSKGTILLKELHKKSTLPVIQKIGSYQKQLTPLACSMLELDILASDLYALGQPVPQTGSVDYRMPFFSKKV